MPGSDLPPGDAGLEAARGLRCPTIPENPEGALVIAEWGK